MQVTPRRERIRFDRPIYETMEKRDVDGGDFARAIMLGTWREPENMRIPPLIYRWDLKSLNGSVGDFVWPGYGHGIAITEHASDVLSISNLTSWSVSKCMLQRPNPKTLGKKRTALLESMPVLHEFWMQTGVAVDEARSTLVSSPEFPQVTVVTGAEDMEVRVNSRTRQMSKTRTRRKHNFGL